MFYYSPSTGGFYASDIDYPSPPGDLVEVSPEKHAALIEGQSQGRVIEPGPDGGPVLVDAPEPAFNAKAYAAQKRYERETGGIRFGGVLVNTDEVAQRRINGAFALAKDDPTQTFRWKNPDGTFTEISNAAMIGIGRAVGAHIQACFSAECNVCDLIDAGEITTPEQIDAFGWPV